MKTTFIKTYLKQIKEPRLVITYDNDAVSPRENDNVGLFFTKENRYKSPDGNTHPLYQIMMETEDEAKDTKHHIELMKAAAVVAFSQSGPKDGNSHDEDLHIIEVYPVYRYEHSGVAYKRGTAGGFDYSNCGFYIITAKSIANKIHTAKSIAKNIDAELAEYTNWLNGEIYAFTLYDEAGEIVDSCGGFYEIEDIHFYLPKEWKGEKLEEYLNI